MGGPAFTRPSKGTESREPPWQNSPMADERAIATSALFDDVGGGFFDNFCQISAKSSRMFASKIQESKCKKSTQANASKIQESKCKKSTQAKNHPEIRTENRKHETTKRKTKPRSTTAALREQHHHAESH